jgi:hypothetical protein
MDLHPYLPHVLSDLSATWHNGSEHNAVKHLGILEKLDHGRSSFLCGHK